MFYGMFSVYFFDLNSGTDRFAVRRDPSVPEKPVFQVSDPRWNL